MLSFREQLAKGIFTKAVDNTNKIPKKSEFKGTITEEGFCDFDPVPDDWYITKDDKRGTRLYQSTKARRNRKEVKKLRYGADC